MKRDGCTEQERGEAILMLKEGATLDAIKAKFSNVEADYFDRNAADFKRLAETAIVERWGNERVAVVETKAPQKPAAPSKPAESQKPKATKPADPLA